MRLALTSPSLAYPLDCREALLALLSAVGRDVVELYKGQVVHPVAPPGMKHYNHDNVAIWVDPTIFLLWLENMLPRRSSRKYRPFHKLCLTQQQIQCLIDWNNTNFFGSKVYHAWYRLDITLHAWDPLRSLVTQAPTSSQRAFRPSFSSVLVDHCHSGAISPSPTSLGPEETFPAVVNASGNASSTKLHVIMDGPPEMLIQLHDIPMPRWTVVLGAAYFLDLTQRNSLRGDANHGTAGTIVSLIVSQSSDLWTSRYPWRIASNATPSKLPALGDVPCQVAELFCEGISYCQELDMSLLEPMLHRNAPASTVTTTKGRCSFITRGGASSSSVSFCSFRHVGEDGHPVNVEMIGRKCPAIMRVWHPVDAKDWRAVVMLEHTHSHPVL